MSHAKEPCIQEVLDFWFGPLKNREVKSNDKNALWFGGNVAFDQEIRDRFEDLVLKASKRELDFWKKKPRGRLALLILLDQFPRNIYRKSPQAFAFDAIAQELALEGLAQGDDLKLLPIERVFFYLPLEHAENLQLQELSVTQFETLASNYPESQDQYHDYAEYARRHHAIIARFGRFPHRNTILGRTSTHEEVAFLKEPNSSF